MKPVDFKDEPDKHDFPAAAAYLSLIAPDDRVEKRVARLAKSDVTHQKAKDILRAAQLPLLPADNAHVAKDLAKIDAGESLSPILLIRGDIDSGAPLQIADGYHRVCASYHVDENTDIACVIASGAP